MSKARPWIAGTVGAVIAIVLGVIIRWLEVQVPVPNLGEWVPMLRGVSMGEQIFQYVVTYLGLPAFVGGVVMARWYPFSWRALVVVGFVAGLGMFGCDCIRFGLPPPAEYGVVLIYLVSPIFTWCGARLLWWLFPRYSE